MAPAGPRQTPAHLASKGTPGVAPTTPPLAFPFHLPGADADGAAAASAALAGGDPGAEGQAVRHLPRAEAAHRPDPK